MESITPIKYLQCKDEMPLVSIIIPTLNQGAFIERTLKSVFMQDYPNIEVIIVDGGSKDKTLEILKKYNSRINWISEPDKGEYFAVNKGIGMAKGKYVKYFSSDDILHPKAVSLFVDYMEQHHEVVITYGLFSFIDEKDTILRYSSQCFPFSFKGYLRGTFTHACLAMLIKRSLFNEVGLFDTDYLPADFEFIARVASKGLPIVYLPFLAGGFRYYAGQQSIQRMKEHDKGCLRVVRKYGNLLDYGFYRLRLNTDKIRVFLGKIKRRVFPMLLSREVTTCDIWDLR